MTEIRRRLNRITDFPGPFSFGVNLFFRRASLRCTDVSPDRRNMSFYSRDERTSLMEGYREGNEAVARDFCGGTPLFPEEPSASSKWEYEPGEMQEDLTLYFGELFRSIDEELGSVRKETEVLRRHLFK